MSIVDTDAWTCPHDGCGETVRGTRRHLNHHRGIHARRHGTTRAALRPTTAKSREPAARTDLSIPAAPRQRRRTR